MWFLIFCRKQLLNLTSKGAFSEKKSSPFFQINFKKDKKNSKKPRNFTFREHSAKNWREKYFIFLFPFFIRKITWISAKQLIL